MEPGQWKNSCKLVGTCVDHWKVFGIYQVRQGLEVFCKKSLAFILPAKQDSNTAESVGNFFKLFFIFCAVVFLLAFVSV